MTDDSTDSSHDGPLSGFKIIDLTVAAAGPWSTRILGAQGAEVIKVERVDGGDLIRRAGAKSSGVSTLFNYWNGGKRSVCIDIQQPRGQELVRKLVATADVFVHNLALGNAERIGLGYPDLSSTNPGLVYTYLTGWGEFGPKAGQPAFDSNVQSAIGLAAQQAGSPDKPPTYVKNMVIDKATGLTLAQLITAALLARTRTGRGQRIHTSLLHAGLAFFTPDGLTDVAFPSGGDVESARFQIPPPYKTLDGWIAVTVAVDRNFQTLCSVLGLDELQTDSRFLSISSRTDNMEALSAEMQPSFQKKTTAELAELLEANKIPFGLINDAIGVVNDPQVQAIGAFTILDDPDAGPMRVVRPLGDFSSTKVGPAELAPRLGADTEAVLREVGVSENQLASLRSTKTIA